MTNLTWLYKWLICFKKFIFETSSTAQIIGRHVTEFKIVRSQEQMETVCSFKIFIHLLVIDSERAEGI